ncbi:MAG: hypothetical protein JRH20_31390 [Deltaproteobacteria bacterium]|nr:hypothetical protein [Deltaproteobacteria bacterium]
MGDISDDSSCFVLVDASGNVTLVGTFEVCMVMPVGQGTAPSSADPRA